MKPAYVLGAMLLIFAVPAGAETIPDFVLDKDYQSCLGDAPDDNARAAYCACVRDGMRDWDFDAYATMLMDQAKAGSNAAVPEKIAELAKACITKTLH